MHKLSHQVDGEWLAFLPPAHYRVDAGRLSGHLRGGDPAVFEELAGCLAAPLLLLYVLHTPRGEAEARRYRSPELDADTLRAFIRKFGSFLQSDAASTSGSIRPPTGRRWCGTAMTTSTPTVRSSALPPCWMRWGIGKRRSPIQVRTCTITAKAATRWRAHSSRNSTGWFRRCGPRTSSRALVAGGFAPHADQSTLRVRLAARARRPRSPVRRRSFRRPGLRPRHRPPGLAGSRHGGGRRPVRPASGSGPSRRPAGAGCGPA